MRLLLTGFRSFVRGSLFRAAPIAAISFCSLVPPACVSRVADEGDTVDAKLEVSADEFRGFCTNPHLYLASFFEADGACRRIASAYGAWLPESIFPGAPESVQASACAYRWSGTKGARPDARPLREAAASSHGTLSPICGNDVTGYSAKVRATRSSDVTEPRSIGPMGGSVGCDICGFVVNRDVFVVSPVDNLWHQDFAVGLSNGGFRAFQVDQVGAVASEARAVTLHLPPPPTGSTYVQGLIEIR